MPFVDMGDVVAELDHVDEPDVLERVKTSRALQLALEMSRPGNWWGTGLDPMALFKIAHEEGIPLAWVPRAEVLTELAMAASKGARRSVLRKRRTEILEDCKHEVKECDESSLGEYRHLTDRAITALIDGHHEAAMALAVSVSEPLAIESSTPPVMGFLSEDEAREWHKRRETSEKTLTGKYKWAGEELERMQPKVARARFTHQILIAPIPRFFASWYPGRGQPLPESLSRHVVAHQASRNHFSVENSLVALMLTTSLLREQQEWAEDRLASEIEFIEP
jgi:hypothetical protein